MSNCAKILKDISATPDEIAYIDMHIKGGLETGEITEKIIQEIYNQRFRKQSNKLSKFHTKQFEDKLYDIVSIAKKPYRVLFKFLVGETSGITSRALLVVTVRHQYLQTYL